MKIESIETYVLRVPLGDRTFYSSQCAFPARSSLLVRLITDEGVEGWGEGGQYGPAEPVAACLEHVLAPKLLGRDPLGPTRIWEELYSLVRDFGPKGPYIEAMSAVDAALWDILGTSLDVPVHVLLGGSFRDEVPAYATGCYYIETDFDDPTGGADRMAREAEGFAEHGFAMMKAKIGLLDLKRDARRLQAVRRAVGPDMILAVDANHAYNTAMAVRMARELEAVDARWFEEPVPPEDLAGYRAVKAAADVAIAGGECEYTRYGFRALIEEGCVDIAQPDICVCGGLSEALKIQALASAHGVWTLPHVWGSGVAVATALHFLAAVPSFPHTANPLLLQNEPAIEYDRNVNPLRDELVRGGLTFQDGKLKVPSSPGLGITLDSDVLERYCASRSRVGPGDS